MHRILAWFQLEGDSPRERMRRNPLQLLVLVIGLWVVTVFLYFSFSMFMGDMWATIVIFLGAIAVAFHLRDLLLPSQPPPEGDRE